MAALSTGINGLVSTDFLAHAVLGQRPLDRLLTCQVVIHGQGVLKVQMGILRIELWSWTDLVHELPILLHVDR